jgi:hypothetical protein
MSNPHKMWIVNETSHWVSLGKNGTASKRNPRNTVKRWRFTIETNRIRETSYRSLKKNYW